MESLPHVDFSKLRHAISWKQFKQSLKDIIIVIVLGTVLSGVATLFAYSIPSDLSKDLTLAILNALLTSGTVLFPLAGVVLTFALSSANTRVESLRRDRLAVWIAQQEAHVWTILENKPDTSASVAHQFGPTIAEYDAKIASLQEELKGLGLLSPLVFVLVLVEILTTLRALAEVSPMKIFPYTWVAMAVSLLILALSLLGAIVYFAAVSGKTLARG